MPNRIIRDSLLDSDRYNGLAHDSERLLFLELVLLADDYGLVPVGAAFLRRRTSVCGPKTAEQVSLMLSALADQDLIRTFRSDSGSFFAYIPRFGNWPRAQKPKWPMPPDALGGNEIKELQQKRTTFAPRLHTFAPETETETETETEEIRESNLTVASARRTADHALSCPHLEILKAWEEELPTLPRHNPNLWRGARADHLRARWREAAASDGFKTEQDGIEYMRRLFRYIGKSEFLTGRAHTPAGRRPFVAELEWLVKPANWAKVLEGKYHA